MNRLTFWRLISSLCLLGAGCAESAIPSDGEPADPSTDSTGKSDGLDAAADAELAPRDSGTPRRDATTSTEQPVDAGDAGRTALADGGLDASRPDAGRDATVQDTGTGPIACSNGQTTCGSACVTLATDVNNCGGCGTKCASGQTCQANQCTGGEPQFNVPSGCTKKTLNNHGYAFCTSTRGWRDARTACLDVGLDLAIVTDKAESDFIKANGDSWIAVNDRNTEGSYKHVIPGNRDRTDGATATYFNWKLGEPNNDKTCDGFSIPVVGCFGSSTDEDCTVIYADGGWNDGACEERRNFVCETY
ncbi:MAG TPA: lectin-like protein [Polyangiales bacterium]|nr:lectin-like protein [Polyangiales bacterium]